MSSALELFMRRAGIKDEVREILKELAKYSLKDILSYALKGEIDSTELYRFLSEKLPEGYPTERFREFMKMEEDHDRKVMEIFEALFPGEEPSEIRFKTWSQVFREGDYRLETVRDYLDVLSIGMDAEQLSEGVYLMLHDLLENPKHKKTFLKLAEDEKYHYEFLKREYEFYSKIEAEKALRELIKELKGSAR
ncbi:rubrerythrin [Thermococcus chitonophagus]|uniref:Rubrerythrin n=1 Tax=Thermococcus chitonophagus TaxID=54262 RepID=A0A170SCY8_9EURY|nr:ferritin family protein [Thermococcus chitonophagus]ASJ15960.1 rubrerythrin [Thermococcus chitonophagus]CUX77204.1 Rubrerythrin [Thermococcus chitonophagus]